MLQAKQSFESSIDISSLRDIVLPWKLNTNEMHHIEQIMNCQINNTLPKIPILSWVKIALNLDYLIPGEKHLFLNDDEDDIRTESCGNTSIYWQQFHLKLIEICNTQDTHAAFLLAIFSGNTDVIELLNQVKSIPINLNHLFVFSDHLINTYESNISSDGLNKALFYCFQVWSSSSINLKYVFPYTEDDAGLDKYYGHSWIMDWLRKNPNVICAGGSIVNCLNNCISDAASDIDLFVNSYEDWIETAKQLQQLIPEPSPLVVQGCLVTWMCPAGYGNVQLIYTKFKTPEELTSNFDMDYVQVWFENGIYKTTGLGAIAWNTRCASSTCSPPKYLLLLKAVEKGFQVEGITDEIISDLKKSTLYNKNKNKHLHDILPNSDKDRALFLANAIFKDSGVKIYRSIEDALQNGFKPNQFGLKQSTIQISFDFDYNNTELQHEKQFDQHVPSSEIISPDQPTAILNSNYFKIRHGENGLRKIVPAIQIEPGSLLCPFGVTDLANNRANANDILLNIKSNRTISTHENENILDAFQTIHQICRSALNDELTESNDSESPSFLRISDLDNGDSFVDLKTYIDQNTSIIDSKTKLPISTNNIPAGCYLDCVLVLSTIQLNEFFKQQLIIKG